MSSEETKIQPITVLRASSIFEFPTEEKIVENLQLDAFKILLKKIDDLTYENLPECISKMQMDTLNSYGDYFLDRKKPVCFYFYYHTYIKNDSHGLWGVARCYFYGLGVSKNTIKAIDLLEQSAVLKDPYAMTELSKIYIDQNICVGGKVVYKFKSNSEHRQKALQMLLELRFAISDKLLKDEIQLLLNRF